MSERQQAFAHYVLQPVLFLSLILFALYQFKRHTAPQPIYFINAEQALKSGDERTARKEFDDSLLKRPGDPEAYFSILDACIHQNKPGLEVEYAQRAIKACRRETPQVRFVLYRILSEAYGQIERVPHQRLAIEAAKSALDLVPDNHIMENEYGYLLADNATGRGPDVDTALVVLKRALNGIKNGPVSLDEEEIGPRFKAMTEDSYGWALYKNEQYSDAVTAITQALEDYPDKAPGEDKTTSYYHLGMAFSKLGKREEAINSFNSALAYDAKYEDALAALGDLRDSELKGKSTNPAIEPLRSPHIPDSTIPTPNPVHLDKKN